MYVRNSANTHYFYFTSHHNILYFNDVPCSHVAEVTKRKRLTSVTYVFLETGCEAISMENGRITFDQDPLGDGYPIGTVLNATCNDGYYLSYSSDNVQYYSDNCTLGTLGRGVWHHHPLTGLIECWLGT